MFSAEGRGEGEKGNNRKVEGIVLSTAVTHTHFSVTCLCLSKAELAVRLTCSRGMSWLSIIISWCAPFVLVHGARGQLSLKLFYLLCVLPPLTFKQCTQRGKLLLKLLSTALEVLALCCESLHAFVQLLRLCFHLDVVRTVSFG